MKQYASHYVWQPGHPPARMQVVRVDEGHRVVSVSPFTAEQAHTIWLGGVILVAPSFPLRGAGESFQAYLSRLQSMEDSSQPLHACHIEDFDLSQTEFTSTSRFVAL